MEEPSDYHEEPVVHKIAILDKTELPDLLKIEIFECLKTLNILEIHKQIEAVIQLVINHEDKYAKFALSPKEIWDVIENFNQTLYQNL